MKNRRKTQARQPEKAPVMNDGPDSPKRCAVQETDRLGHANLCCCYIMDAEGELHDPCYQPVDACCP